jgi:undecaprenyl-diphosphatase
MSEIMDTTTAIILGAIQGLAEWLPISSEGMTSLYLTSKGMTLAEAIPLSIWLHTGTLIAATIYFRKDLKNIISDLPKYLKKEKTETKDITTFLILATLMTGIIGLPIIVLALDELNFAGSEATALIGILLIVTGLIQKKAEKKSKNEKPITKKDGMIVGTLQAFSALPGLSRSGLTTSGLLLGKYEANQALRLSFLMSVPAVLAAEIGLNLLDPITIDRYSIIMSATSFIIGYATISLMIKVAKKVRFSIFCILLGLFSIIPYLLGM